MDPPDKNTPESSVNLIPRWGSYIESVVLWDEFEMNTRKTEIIVVY